MRKHGGLFFVALLLLLAPSLASAWTLYVKGQGSSSDGTIYIQDTTTPGALNTALASTYVVKMNGGQKYVQLTGDARATVVLGTNIAADVTINYVTTQQEPPTTAVPFVEYDLDEGTGSMIVSWGQAASAQGDVAVVKDTGGTTLVQYLGQNTMTGYTGLAFNTTVGIKANPNSDYEVTSITLTKTSSGGTVTTEVITAANKTVTVKTPLGAVFGIPATTTPGFGDAGTGEAKTVALLVNAPDIKATADYTLVPSAKAVLSAPLRAVVDSTVVLSANGSTSNDSSVTYEFKVNNVLVPNTLNAKNVTYIPTTDVDLTVVLNIKKGTAVLASKTASIEVVTAASVNNNLCIGCHAGSTPAIVAAYNTGTHGSTAIACIDCHGDAPHSVAAEGHLTVAANDTNCASCHSNAPYEELALALATQHNGGTAFHKAQYVSDASLPVSCSSCHDGTLGTSGNAAILTQFAASGHADAEGDAWRQFDWRSASRISCQRCHTGTGFVAKLDIADTSNAFTASDILKPGEVLNCSTCHSDVETGGLRTASPTFSNGSSSGSISYNVVGASALCARCHGGRESGQAIKDDGDTTGIRAFISPHFLAAAATLYGKGYEFSGQTYDLGTNKDLGSAEEGPCVACHMAAKNHSMTAAAPVDAATKKAAVAAALVNLKTALAAKGIHYSDKHPYFYTAAYAGRDITTNEPGVNTAFTNWATPFGASSWKDTMGAAFNYQLLLNEPGAYAHNYDYTMQLIADSIAFLTTP